MRLLRLVLPTLSVGAFVFACSSSDSTPISGGVDGGGSSGSSGTSGSSGSSGSSGTSGSSGNGDGSAPPVDSGTDSADASTAFALTSTAYVAGASIPAMYTCNGANGSPPLAWTAGPAGTMSYAIVFTDLTNTGIHSVIYDIPSNVLSLAAGVDKAYAPAVPAGAHQTPPGFNAGGFGYLGPCPPKPGGVAEEHVYEFELYAVNVAALPGATMTTTTTAARTLIQANSLGSTKLTAKYKQP